MSARRLLYAVVLFAWARPAAAQPASAAVDEAKTRFTLAQKLYNQNKFAEAIDEFKAAYAVMPDPAFDFDIAQSYEKLDDLANAKVYFERTLNESADTSPYREKAAAELGEIDARLAKGATSLPASVPQASAAASPAASLSAAPSHEGGPSAPGLGAPFWISASVTGALFTGGAIFGIASRGAASALHAYPKSVEEADSDVSNARTDAYIADGLFAAGVVAAGVTGWMAYRAYRHPEESTPSVTAFVAPGGAAILVTGSWGAW